MYNKGKTESNMSGNNQGKRQREEVEAGPSIEGVSKRGENRTDMERDRDCEQLIKQRHWGYKWSLGQLAYFRSPLPASHKEKKRVQLKT